MFSQSEQEKINQNVYHVYQDREKRNSPQMSSLSRSPVLKDKFQRFDVSYIFQEMEIKKRKDDIENVLKKMSTLDLERLIHNRRLLTRIDREPSNDLSLRNVLGSV